MTPKMYSLGKGKSKPFREDKSRESPKMPSFSSTLLDEIYRSIDGPDEKFERYREKPVKKQTAASNGPTIKAKIEDEELASLRRACLIEKWMEKEVSEKLTTRRRQSSLPEFDNVKSLQDNDLIFFSSTSSSSDSSGALSSSDTEFFGSTKSKVSCFTGTRPKPVRTSVSKKSEVQNDEYYLFDDYIQHQANKTEEEANLIKSKSRALKIYANLKKVKQPISPGGRLTSFINSLFSNAGAKKANRNPNSSRVFEDVNAERKTNSTQASSTCSSASSFSRSCLSKSSSKSTDQKPKDGIKRTVRFHPVSVIVDEDSRPCGHKCLYNDNADNNINNKDYSGKFGKPPLARNATVAAGSKSGFKEKERRIEVASRNAIPKAYNKQTKDDFALFKNICNKYNDEDDEEDYDDAASDTSSDLFEIDHLALFSNNRFSEELPVYETTHLGRNRAISATSLIR